MLCFAVRCTTLSSVFSAFSAVKILLCALCLSAVALAKADHFPAYFCKGSKASANALPICAKIFALPK